jgi:imidazolonepropionase-like amidohydrolase
MLILKGSQLIDGNGGVVRDAAVLVDGKRVKQAGRAAEIASVAPPDAEVVDMGGCTLMPGLIDCHMHMEAFNILTTENYRVATFEVTPQLQMLQALLNAQLCFEMGLTTIRSQGWIGYTGQLTAESLAIRDAIERGFVAGPRIKVSGWATVTGSHLDLILIGNAPRPAGTTADGPWELRKQVRSNIRMGVDWTKTSASGGGGTDKEEPGVRNMSQEELNAIVEESHYHHKPVTCHCFTPEAQKMAVRAGVDTLEHAVFTDDEALAMIVGEGKPVIPTLAHRTDHAIEVRRRAGTSEFTLNKMKRLQPYTKETFQRMHQAGVKMAMGTDTQLDPEMGSQAIELEVYVEYGMTPMEAIQTATRNAAEALQIAKDVGTIEAGKFADIIAVDGDPLLDIRVLQERNKIRLVMKEGRVYLDRRPGHEKYVIHDQSYGWKRL